MKIDKVLMVDDDVHIRKIAEISLKGVGKWQVCLASSGKEALEMAQSERPDVILMDVTMPEMDGRETFVQLRKLKEISEVPVIFLTGRILSEELEEYRKLGVAGVIRKPFDPLKLPQEIRQMLKAE